MQPEFKESMKELARRIEFAMRSGYIQKPAYDVGMHILAIMLEYRSTEVTFTWNELATSAVTRNGKILADSAPTTHYEMYGALQQLENRLGLITHINRAALLEHVQEGRQDGKFNHVTAMPGEDSHLIVGKTVVLCCYEEWVGATLDDDISSYLKQMETARKLPGWTAVGAA